MLSKKLKEIATAKADIDEAKADCKERIEENEETIAEAEKAIKAIENGEFDDALTVKDRLTDLPQTHLWTCTTATGTSIVLGY